MPECHLLEVEHLHSVDEPLDGPLGERIGLSAIRQHRESHGHGARQFSADPLGTGSSRIIAIEKHDDFGRSLTDQLELWRRDLSAHTGDDVVEAQLVQGEHGEEALYQDESLLCGDRSGPVQVVQHQLLAEAARQLVLAVAADVLGLQSTPRVGHQGPVLVVNRDGNTAAHHPSAAIANTEGLAGLNLQTAVRHKVRVVVSQLQLHGQRRVTGWSRPALSPWWLRPCSGDRSRRWRAVTGPQEEVLEPERGIANRDIIALGDEVELVPTPLALAEAVPYVL